MSASHTRGVLVTGAASPLSQALVRALTACPEIHGVVTVYPPGEVCPTQERPGIVHVNADLTRHRDVQNLLQGVAMAARVDTIVHGCQHPFSREHGADSARLHVESTRHLLSVAEEQPQIKRFVLRSFHDVYRLQRDSPILIDESQPLELSPHAPEASREHAESDLIACAKMAVSRLQIVVLRCAELLAAGVAGQLYDYLSSRVCLRPLGYDPMINVLSLPDAARALHLAVMSDAIGIFNVPGKDSLPLSELIDHAARLGVALPGLMLRPLYDLRTMVTKLQFDYELDRLRFHRSCILEGSKAREQLHYSPQVSAFPFPQPQPSSTHDS